MIRVVLADDEPLIRVGVRTILATDPAIEVTGEAATGPELVELAARTRPDVALLDIRMPGGGGLGAVAHVRRASPGTAVAMLTTFGKDDYIARALTEGASGFLLKAGDPRELIAGVHALAAGGAYLSAEAAAHMTRRMAAARPDPAADTAARRIAALTPRERQVLALLAQGLPNAEIARRLHLAEDTVKTHVSAILTGLGATNRVQAAITAHQAGLTPT
ncbi:response regulator [Nocardiopsis potens]|uniref:response regulator n=1 Tax=Nocardiopsis potens TaxID=1246458 RepID=UPI00034CDAF2|nr:response regulator transcription factor [Nocardiopsis potens]